MRLQLQSRRRDVHFAGQRSGEDLARHVASGDLFLFPSKTETFGNVVTEALSSAVPVIAFDHAAAAQLVRTNVNGWRVPLENDKAFVDATIQAAMDHERLTRWGQEARKSVLSLDWNSIVAQFEGELREVLMPAEPALAVAHARAVPSSLLQ